MNRYKYSEISYKYCMGIRKLVEWRNSIEDKQKAKRIQRVIDRRLEYLERTNFPLWIMLYNVDVFGTKWGDKE